MKTKLTYSIAAAIILLGATIVGCSGSGGSSDDVSTSLTTLQGTFVDGSVDGLSYTGRLSGTTKDGGHYSYQGTDKVKFSLGKNLNLGEVIPSTSWVSVLDLFNPVKTINDVNDSKVVNLLVLLQSLDFDGNTSNGITITPESIAALEDALVTDYFPDLASVDFKAMPLGDLQAALQVVVDSNVSDSDVLVTPEDAVEHFEETVYGPQPPSTEISGSLACTPDASISDDAKDFNASQTVKKNVSSTSLEDANKQNPTAQNTIERLDAVVPAQSADGNLTGGDAVHPILISYAQQIVGEYETSDGSADIGDPTHIDGIFLGLSLDNGETWKNTTISDTTDKSSMEVVWDIDKNAAKIPYPGHAQKPTMAINGNNILIAWNDKYCPSGNPFDLVQDADTGKYPDDFFAVNGAQGSIDYADAQDGSRVEMIAPNGKHVYEVPFSCVWTARGIVNPDDGNITWHAPMQLTTGTRDSNHIWLAGAGAGFAISWQEDTEGLRSGKGEGPGEGWSGATTNHGSDVWYTSIKMEDFAATAELDDETTRPKSLNNFHYPVRMSDNQSCSNDDTKIYCKSLCDTYGYVTSITNNTAANEVTRCNTYDVDMLTDTQVVLDGDTGASRTAQKLLTTDTGQTVVIFGYEETKGLSENTSGTGDQDQGDSETIIAFEGKSVYFESFLFDAIDDFNSSDPDILQKVAMPLVSAGNIVNVKVPDQNDTSNMIYENARRLVIGTQIDSCGAGESDGRTFAFMYKQSFETQGASSDMFIRVNNGLTYDSFVPLNDPSIGDLNVTNISAQVPFDQDGNITDYTVSWSADNLDDYTYENPYENTFSPRIFLRGNDIFTGFEYTPNDDKTSIGNMPSNFHAHIYTNGAWLAPQNITQVVKGGSTTVDARFFTTPKGDSSTGLESDNSNPNVLFITWGEIDWIDNEDHDLGKAESNIYYKRALFDGTTWNWDANTSILAARDGAVLQEKEVESFTTPDGKTVYNVWLQETELADYNSSDPFTGLDSWFGRIDYNITK